jgi:4-amino-4-deoxy-L-arabinose transferase-like glycosyltransferase
MTTALQTRLFSESDAKTEEFPVVPPPLGVRPSRGRRLARAIPALVALLVVGVLYLGNLNGFPRYINDDEGTYVAQAWAVLNEHYMASYTYWYDHPPLGWLQIAAVIEPLAWLTGAWTLLGAGRAFMGIVAIITALLMYKLARNLGLPRLVASAGPLIWALSPLTLTFGRQVYLDNIALMWTMAALVLVTNRARLELAILSGICFGIAVLSKETVALALPGILYALWQTSWKKTRVFAFTGWTLAFVLTGLGYVLFAGIKGEIFPSEGRNSLWEGIFWQLSGRGASGFIFDAGTISNETLMTWWRADPYLLGLGAVATLAALFVRRLRPLAAVPIVHLLVSMRGGYVPNMFPIAPNAFFGILIAAVVWHGWNAVRHRRTAGKYSARFAVASIALLALVFTTPSWAASVKIAMTEKQNEAQREGLAWITQNISTDTSMLVDNDTWTDLVEAGWSPDRWHGPVWHYKLDRDPEARLHMPNAWRDLDYVLLAPGLSSQINTNNMAWDISPQVISAMQNSTVVKSWGEFPFQVELRKVDPTSPVGCRRWTCPVDEPAWINPDGIAGSPDAKAAGQRLLARVEDGTATLPNTPPLLPRPEPQDLPVALRARGS